MGKENEPDIYSKIHKIMLPGDYIVFKFSEKITTTICGLSEGVFFGTSKKTRFLIHYSKTLKYPF